MLLRIERKILRIISSSNDSSIELSQIGKYNGEDVYQSFLELMDKGYLRMAESNADRSSFSYILTPKGKYYKEYIFMEFLRNILIPFIVALITATATYHLEKVADGYTTSGSSQGTDELNSENNPRLEFVE